MNDVVIAIVTAGASIIVAVIAAYVGLRRDNHETRVAIDGRLTELLETAKLLARSEGVAQGEQDERDRNAP